MTNRQQQLLADMTRINARLQARDERLGESEPSTARHGLELLITAIEDDAFEQRGHTRAMARLCQVKNTITAALRKGGRPLLAAAPVGSLIAALRNLERQHRVHHLRRVAATEALALHERAGRVLLRHIHRSHAAEAGERCRSTSR